MELIGLISASVSISAKAYELFKKQGANRNSGRDTIARVAAAVREPECLMRAVKDGDVRLVANLLDLGAADHINRGHQVKLRSWANGNTLVVSGFTPLMLAALGDNAPMINLLLDYGADIEARCCDERGTLRSAVVLAVFYNRLRAAHALLEAGADAAHYRTNDKGLSLIAFTHKRGSNRMCAMLRQYL